MSVRTSLFGATHKESSMYAIIEVLISLGVEVGIVQA